MRDFTTGSVALHIVSTAAPVTLSMFVQTAYHLVDLYFVTKIGVAATAGVNIAANALFVIQALSLVLTVGTAALVAQAVGRRDHRDANSILNQSLMLSVACALAVTSLLYACVRPYMRSVTADSATIQAGTEFMLWVAPGYALMLPMAILSCALRATGIVQASVVAYTMTVGINAVLAPVLIAGWGTGMPMGVPGAGLATSIAVTVGITLLSLRFHKLQPYMAVQRSLLRPRLEEWRRILGIGFPSGGEFAIIFFCTAVVYYAIRDAGAAPQAGFGVGSRVLQVMLVPAMAIASATGPIASQNFGAQHAERVRETFNKAALIGTGLMLLLSMSLHWQATAIASVFSADTAANAVATEFLRLMSWTLVPQSLVYTCLGLFQGLGNTMPALLSSTTRLFTFVIPIIWLSGRSTFRIEHVWYLSIVSLLLQAVVSGWLLHLEFAKHLLPPPKSPIAMNGAGLVGAAPRGAQKSGHLRQLRRRR